MPSVDRMWRTLVHVGYVSEALIVVDLPGWHGPRDAVFTVWRRDLPPEVDAALQMQEYLHARVNLGADRAEDVRFSDWEPS